MDSYNTMIHGALRIERVNGEDKKGTAVRLKTAKMKFLVKCTKTGYLRFFDDKGECCLVRRNKR